MGPALWIPSHVVTVAAQDRQVQATNVELPQTVLEPG